jgi:hypothetical protein
VALRDDLDYWSWSPGPGSVLYDTTALYSTVVTSLSLLLTSRRISTETRSVLDRVRRRKRLSYALDVMFVNGEQLWPTWLCVPALADHIDSLTATIRICGPAGRKK